MKCFYHPDVDGVGICQQCGKFCCRQCIEDVSGTMLCNACVERERRARVAQEAEERQEEEAEALQESRQAARRIKWSWVVALLGGGYFLFLAVATKESQGNPFSVSLVPLGAYFCWAVYWGLVWFWPRWRQKVGNFRRALSGWIIIARPAAWFMILFFYVVFYLSVPIVVAIYYGIFGGAFVQYKRHRALASNALTSGASSAESGRQSISQHRRSPYLLPIGGSILLAFVVLSGVVSLSRQGFFSKPMQQVSFPQTATQPPQKPKSLAPAVQPGQAMPQTISQRPQKTQGVVPSVQPAQAIPQTPALALLQTGVVATSAEVRGWKDYVPKNEFHPGEALFVYAEALNVNQGGRIDVTFSVHLAGPVGTPLALAPERVVVNTADPSCWKSLELPPETNPGTYVAQIEIRNNLTGQTGHGSTNFAVLSPKQPSYAEASWTGLGWIADSQCGAKAANELARECTIRCVQEHGAKYVFVRDTDKKVYAIEEQSRVAGYASYHVAVKGTVQGETIRVASIEMARRPE